MANQKRIVHHPVLFTLYPILELYFNVSENLPFGDAVRTLIVVPILAVLLLLLAKWHIKDWDRAGFLTLSGLIWFFYYGIIYRAVGALSIGNFRLGRHSILFPLWTVFVALIASRWVWKQLRDHRMVTKFLNFAAIVAITLSASRFVIKVLSYKPVDPQTFASAVAGWGSEFDVQLESDTKPDIYYIVLDGYGRSDVLQEMYGFDNAEFLTFLKSHGFYVAGGSQANYIQTTLSLAASLNFDYLDDLSLPKDSADRVVLAQLIANSRVRTLLEDFGYTIVSANSGYELSLIEDADFYFTSEPPESKITSFEGLVLMGSAAVLLIDQEIIEVPAVGYNEQRERVRSGFDYLEAASEVPGPKFVFFHIVAPHPPFLLDREGNSVTPDIPYAGWADGDHFYGTTAQYVAGYTEQLRFVNMRMTQIIDSIFTQSADPPIIIVQGDHGPGSLLNWESPQRTCLRERVSILNAYYMPDGDSTSLYSDVSPVNTFRIIFDAHFATDLGLLEDRSYYSPWTHPYDYIEIGENDLILCHVP